LLSLLNVKACSLASVAIVMDRTQDPYVQVTTLLYQQEKACFDIVHDICGHKSTNFQ